MKLKNIAIGVGASATMIASTVLPVLAASVVSNGSFEAGEDPGVFSTQVPGSTAIEDWNVVLGNVDYIGSYWQASDGDRSIDMTGNTAGAISQELTTTPGAVYTVTFDLSGNPDGGPTVKSLNVDAGGAPTAYTYDTAAAGNTRTDMKWEEQSFTFTAATAATTLTFTSLDSGFYGPALDNVSVEQYLPETKDDCKKDGWMEFGVFKNQGDCVSYAATGGSNLPAGQ